MAFNFKGQEVRTVVCNGETWFVAADVCAILGHANPRQAIARLDNDEKGVHIEDTLGGPQAVNIINESGMYGLVLTSGRPEARSFLGWVTGEVIPSIRRTGGYEHPAATSAASWHSSGDAVCDEQDELSLRLREPGRYVVLVIPGWAPHVRRAPSEAILEEESALECEILCHALKLIECWWQKTEQMDSIGQNPIQGFAFDRLEHTVLDGGHIAEQYLCVGRQKLHDKQT